MTRMLLVRHGQSQWNLQGRLQGATAHVPLTELGRAQAGRAAAAVRSLAPGGVDAIWSSDLLRARQTAEVIAVALRRPVALDARLREQGQGVLEGLTSAEALAAATWDLTDADARAPGGESLCDVHARIGACLDDLAAARPDATLVLVTHGDTIRVACSRQAGLGPDRIAWHDVPNGSVTELVVTPAAGRKPPRPVPQRGRGPSR